jgi:hypothetical protein
MCVGRCLLRAGRGGLGRVRREISNHKKLNINTANKVSSFLTNLFFPT